MEYGVWGNAGPVRPMKGIEASGAGRRMGA
jgi:hypothetical protein